MTKAQVIKHPLSSIAILRLMRTIGQNGRLVPHRADVDSLRRFLFPILWAGEGTRMNFRFLAYSYRIFRR
jgi:hypothetical protein